MPTMAKAHGASAQRNARLNRYNTRFMCTSLNNLPLTRPHDGLQTLPPVPTSFPLTPFPRKPLTLTLHPSTLMLPAPAPRFPLPAPRSTPPHLSSCCSARSAPAR